MVINKKGYQTIDEYFNSIENTKAITIIAGGQYELRIKPNGSVIHNFDCGTWQPLDADNFIGFNYGSDGSTVPEKIIIADKDTRNIMYVLYRPSIILSYV